MAASIAILVIKKQTKINNPLYRYQQSFAYHMFNLQLTLKSNPKVV